MVSNRKKERTLKRESSLLERVVSKRFVIAWAFNEKSYGVFFAISAKSASPVLRNRIKRIFRELVLHKIDPVLDKERKEKLSLCLISKKGVRFSNFDQEMRDELERIVDGLAKTIR